MGVRNSQIDRIIFRTLSIVPSEVMNQDKFCVINNNKNSENNHTNTNTDKTIIKMNELQFEDYGTIAKT